MESNDSIYDIFRFLQISTRGIANSQRGHSRVETSVGEQGGEKRKVFAHQRTQAGPDEWI